MRQETELMELFIGIIIFPELDAPETGIGRSLPHQTQVETSEIPHGLG